MGDARHTVEVTGAPGSGKTTFIREAFPGRTVLLGGLPLSYGKAGRVVASVFLPLYAVAIGSIKPGQVWWLVKESARYGEKAGARLNAFRNALLKFCSRLYAPGEDVVIDEGISHIPFILGLEGRGIDRFLELFRPHLEGVSIIFLQAPPDEVLKDRLIARGHKRIRRTEDAEGFVAWNVRIAEQYGRALRDSGLDVSFR